MRTVKTTSFGAYSFAGAAADETYLIGVAGKQHSFPESTQIVTANSDVSGIDFIAEN